MRAILVRVRWIPTVMRLENVPTPQPGPWTCSSGTCGRRESRGGTSAPARARAREPTPLFIPGADGAGESKSVGPQVADVKGSSAGDRRSIARPQCVGGRLQRARADYALCTPRGSSIGSLRAASRSRQGRGRWASLHDGVSRLVHSRSRPAGRNRVRSRRDWRRRHRGRADRPRTRHEGHPAAGAPNVDWRTRAVRQGVAVVVNHREPGTTLNEVMRVTGGRGVDLVPRDGRAHQPRQGSHPARAARARRR